MQRRTHNSPAADRLVAMGPLEVRAGGRPVVAGGGRRGHRREVVVGGFGGMLPHGPLRLEVVFCMAVAMAILAGSCVAAAGLFALFL
jgi:hypothetical protein